MTRPPHHLDYAAPPIAPHARKTIQLLYAASLLQFVYTLWFAGGVIRIFQTARSWGIPWNRSFENSISGIPVTLTLSEYLIAVIVMIALYLLVSALFLFAALRFHRGRPFWRFAAFALSVAVALLTLGDIAGGTGKYLLQTLFKHGWNNTLLPSAIHLTLHALLFTMGLILAFRLPRYCRRPM